MLCLIDVDTFKSYNDTHGHPKGDSAIRKLGALLNRITRRSTESAFRVGGEAFAIITNLEECSEGLKQANTLLDWCML